MQGICYDIINRIKIGINSVVNKLTADSPLKRVLVIILILGFGSPCKAQIISARFPDPDSLNIIEKVYLHTDRNYYYPADDIWFKAYLIDASDRSLSDNSNNLHIELISPAAKIIDSRIVRLEEGLGKGDFHLPQKINAGTYRIRAYTNYMRNFGEQLFFQKEITIINPQDSIENISERSDSANNRFNITFFPEGGSLVYNVSSIVAFKANDATGAGCDTEGEIFSSDGKLNTTFRTSHLGMGSFLIRPQPGSDYYAIVRNRKGDKIRTEIPKIFSRGVTLSIAQNHKSELIVTIRTNSETQSLVSQNDLMLTISARKTVIKTMGFRIKSLSNSLIIPTYDLPDGILMFTLTGLGNLPLCERLFYLQNNEEISLNVESDKEIYEKRDSVSVKISLTDDSGIPRDAFLSLSASEKISDENNPQFNSTITSWFLLESDVRGPVEAPGYYFNPSNKNRISDLNLLLLTQGWRDFEWKYKEDHYLTENGFSVSGRLRKLFTDKPLETSNINIGIFESKSTFSTAIPTDTAGKFRFDGIILTGEARLIISGVNKKGEPRGLLALDSLKYSPAIVSEYIPQPKLLMEKTMSELIQKYEIINTTRKKYTLSDTINLGEVVINAKKTEEDNPQLSKVKRGRSIYGIPDIELIITPQLEGFANVLEVIRGRVPGVIVLGYNPDFRIYVRGFGSVNSGTQPVFLIDGAKVFLEDILALPLSCVDRIDILKGGITAAFGMQGGNGVISVITRSGDRLASYRPVNHSANIKMYGYNAARVFYSPKHSKNSEAKYEPDFRTTLFWKPDIYLKPDSDQYINYFNADNSGTIEVIAEGITVTGIPVTARTEYKIR
jgi:hypothetical protein